MSRQRKSRSARRREFALEQRLQLSSAKSTAPVSESSIHRPVKRQGDSTAMISPVKVLDPTHQKIETALQGVLDKRRTSKPNPKQVARKVSDPSAARPFRGSRQLQYHRESQRAWICWLFVLPLILVYESVTINFAGQAVRSGLDQWLAYFLNWFGLSQLIILPLVVTGILLVAHHRRQDQWNFSPTVLGWMVVESLGLGMILFWAANAVFHSSQTSTMVSQSIAITSQAWWPQTIAVIGSGIYEELIFRLILLTVATTMIIRWTGIRQAHWIAIAVISLMFASLHYDFVNPAGGAFELSSFLFRVMASVVFSFLFLFRGFGIAVGTHVAFDLVTQI